MIRTPVQLVLLVLLTVATSPAAGAQSTVRVTINNGQFQLLRNGEPYSIRGVGGHEHLPLLVAAGGNSIRTWSPDGLDRLLDEAHEQGLTVCVGMWLGHQRHGFDYQNESAVLKQLNDCLRVVRQYKDHPAVLLWGIGNEMYGGWQLGHMPLYRVCPSCDMCTSLHVYTCA